MNKIETKSISDDRDLKYVWESYSEFAQKWRAYASESYMSGNSKNWVGNNSALGNADHVAELITNGDSSGVELVEKFLAQFESEVGIDEVYSNNWGLNVAGAFPCVPAYLSNEPENMFAQTPIESPTATTIYFSSTCSGNLSAELMLKRGAVISTLALLLSRVRPVQLVSYDLIHVRREGLSKNFSNIIPLEHSPLSIPHLVASMCRVGFQRTACYGIANREGFSGMWAKAYQRDNYGGAGSNMKHVRAFLDAKESDIVIGGAYSSDSMLTDTKNWLRDHLRKQGIRIEGEGGQQ